MRIRVLDGELLRRLVDPDAMARVLRTAMIEASLGRCVLPLRWALGLPDARGALGMMPGYLSSGDLAGIKLISLVPAERRGGRPSHLGLMLLYDAEGLQPVAMLCGSTLTALRTAASTALATDALARADAKVLAVLGTGEQAREHVRALLRIRRFEEVRIWGRTPGHAIRLVEAIRAGDGIAVRACTTVSDAVGRADVICAVTSARTPILSGELVAPGTHVNLVGSSTPEAAEVDDPLVARSRFFVDLRASALAQAGELLNAMRSGAVGADWIAAEIGEVLAGRHAGRTACDEITVYKSLGIAAQDLAVAQLAYRHAEAEDLGAVVSL